MNASIRVFTWCALTLAALLLSTASSGPNLAAATPQQASAPDADHRDTFRAAMVELEGGGWAQAAAYLRQAIALEPTATAEEIRIYGETYYPYLPHYYLGLALYNGGEIDAALTAWDEADRQGRVAEDPERLREFQALRRQARSGQPPASTVPGQVPRAEPRYRPGEYVGLATCASSNCHGRSRPNDVYEVLQNEVAVWLHEDEHSRAFDLLFNDESQLIGRNLRLEGEPQSELVCLRCHAPQPPRHSQAAPFDLTDGVSCESCHGPAGGWLEGHTEEGWSYADSLANGMLDLRRARVRARLCLGCHQGSPERQVDHELIAAGHPELVFELDSYTQAMPPHWQPFDRQRESGRPIAGGVEAWAVGQAVAFRESVVLLQHRARSDTWPEFAEMMCDSCHHPLGEGAWRQQRGYRHRPGLPSWSPARWVVLRHLVSTFVPREREELDRRVERLGEVVAHLGTPTPQVEEAAASMVGSLDRIVRALEQARFTEESLQELIEAIAGDPDFALEADRRSAEQATMSLQTLVLDLTDRRPGSDPELRAAVERLFDELSDPYAYDRDRFLDSLRRLRER